MARRHPDGYVVAQESLSPKRGGGYHTLYWRGPNVPSYRGAKTTCSGIWGPLADAARFADEVLAQHVLRTSLDDTQRRMLDAARTWVEAAPSPRNGGPTGELITAPPTAAAVGAGDVADAPEQGDLFGTLT